MVNLENLAIGGVEIVILIFGIVEFCKEFGIEGKRSRLLQFVLGFFFVGLFSAIEAEMVPAEWLPYVVLTIKCLGGAIAAGGFYEFVRKKLIHA